MLMFGGIHSFLALIHKLFCIHSIQKLLRNDSEFSTYYNNQNCFNKGTFLITQNFNCMLFR